MADRYRPSYRDPGGPPGPPDDAAAAMFHFKASQTNNGSFSNPRAPRRPPPVGARRPLLGSSVLSPRNKDVAVENGSAKFRAPNDFSDSDGSRAEDSTDEQDDPPRKRARPNWSNPDPYTSVPPLHSQDKKNNSDVVKLIRKARISNGAVATEVSHVYQEQDFIALDTGEVQSFDEDLPPSDAPTGPRALVANDSATVLGKRKRQVPAAVGIRGIWQTSGSTAVAPWLSACDSKKDSPGVALHKEILDFYSWIRPQEHELAIRRQTVLDIENALGRLEPGELHAFGSHAAGLFLPTGDIDLVYLIRNRRNHPGQLNGLPNKRPKAMFFRFADFLKKQRIARDNTVQVIYGAKVPIIKFVEKNTGLKIDLCFDNETGLAANKTFLDWKQQFPVMPVLVAVIKHFLMVRRLNDVAMGGLGGFSVICLVASFLQHLPPTGGVNLGRVLLDFFNLYGNLFDKTNVAIRLEPPGYIDKASYTPYLSRKEKPSRLTIIDPNRSDNNISGGSDKIDLIFRCFADAHDTLVAGLEAGKKDEDSSKGVLTSILGTNFRLYELQRAELCAVHSAKR